MRRPLWILAVLLSHWRRHPMQFATLLIGLVSAIALWSGVQALNQQARYSYDRAAAAFGGVRTAALVARNGSSLPAAAVCRASPRRLAGVAGSRGPYPDRRQDIPPARHRTRDAARRSRRYADHRRDDLQAFVTPPGQTRVAPETLAELDVAKAPPRKRATTCALPPLRVAAQFAPGLMVVDIGIAQRLLKMPDQVSRLVDRQDQWPACRARSRSPVTGCAWSSRMRRPISNASPTAFT